MKSKKGLLFSPFKFLLFSIKYLPFFPQKHFFGFFLNKYASFFSPSKKKKPFWPKFPRPPPPITFFFFSRPLGKRSKVGNRPPRPFPQIFPPPGPQKISGVPSKKKKKKKWGAKEKKLFFFFGILPCLFTKKKHNKHLFFSILLGLKKPPFCFFFETGVFFC